ncbi:MAG: hypothetical protein HY849_01805 [Nitrosomonadales bacterium]|nr:hypothetical protein [Nitrosomonadales bacterium]
MDHDGGREPTLGRYLAMDPTDAVALPTNKKEQLVLDFWFLEYLLSQPSFLGRLSDDEKVTLLREALDTLRAKMLVSDADIYGAGNYDASTHLLATTLASVHFQAYEVVVKLNPAVAGCAGGTLACGDEAMKTLVTLSGQFLADRTSTM